MATSRRSKDRAKFARWHDSQADLVRIDLSPGRPGKATAQVLEVDPSGLDLGERFCPNSYEKEALGADPAYGYATQPNHGLNISGEAVWATNLLYGAPLEIDLVSWEPRQILRVVEPSRPAPRVSSTSHFAWSLDGRFAYFHQSLMEAEANGGNVRAADLKIVELDVETGGTHVWRLQPPPEDSASEAHNFHSMFYFEERGSRCLGMLRTGAVVEHLAPHTNPVDHRVDAMPASSIWIVELQAGQPWLQARLLPGVGDLDGLALSHLDVDNAGGDGFVLYANFKEADVAEETHGPNIYGEVPSEVTEHYSGMIVEALNYGKVLRYERREGVSSMNVFERGYDAGRTSLGHTWLPINIELDSSREYLFCTFSGFRPRLLPEHIASAYQARAVAPGEINYVPPLLMRFNAREMTPDYSPNRGYLSYAEPVALCVVGSAANGYACTFSPEIGLRIYRADDLTEMVCHVVTHNIWHWRDSHFHPEPAHMAFVNR